MENSNTLFREIRNIIIKQNFSQKECTIVFDKSQSQVRLISDKCRKTQLKRYWLHNMSVFVVYRSKLKKDWCVRDSKLTDRIVKRK